ncbi:MAG: ClC family H(+)/Cl(-) exchange transporter [Bacillota bacterium]
MRLGNNHTSQILNIWHNLRFRLIIEGIIVGIFAGLIVIFYRIFLEHAENIRNQIYYLISNSSVMIFLFFLALIFVAYILGYIVQTEPLVGGSGIPQIKGQLAGHLFISWKKVIWWKFVGGVLAIGAGLSLGREGPSVQLGGAVGHGLGRLLGRSRVENKYLITCGAGAGLSAAFNAPLAGVIFALEELHKSFFPVVLASAMTASLAANFLSQYFFGQQPVFSFPSLPALPLKYYGLLILLGIILGVLGLCFQVALLRTQQLYKDYIKPAKYRPLIPVIIAGVLGFFLPDVLGGGHSLVIKLGNSTIPLLTLLILCVAKFALTMVSYGSGVPGGIFLPLLVIGALIGNIVGLIMANLSFLPQEFVGNLIVFAMAGYFTAIVKAPITGTVLITEMTGSFSNLFPVSIVCLSAYLITELFRLKPIYDALLEKILVQNRTPLYAEKERKKTILEMPISLGSFLDQRCIKDVEWPQNCLLVGVIRGDQEIIPHGNTKLQMGDYLVILVNDKEEAAINEYLLNLAQNNSPSEEQT